eukprot:1246655-Prymnesium_polylepis.1
MRSPLMQAHTLGLHGDERARMTLSPAWSVESAQATIQKSRKWYTARLPPRHARASTASTASPPSTAPHARYTRRSGRCSKKRVSCEPRGLWRAEREGASLGEFGA